MWKTHLALSYFISHMLHNFWMLTFSVCGFVRIATNGCTKGSFFLLRTVDTTCRTSAVNIRSLGSWEGCITLERPLMFLSRRSIERSTHYNLGGTYRKHFQTYYCTFTKQISIGHWVWQSTSGSMLQIPWQAMDTPSTTYSHKKHKAVLNKI